jgi:central kinetochore subunit Mal2/MCM21
LKEIEKSRRKRRPIDTLNQLKEILNTKSKAFISPVKPIEQEPLRKKSRREKRLEEEHIIPDPVKHEFFDESISKYFNVPVSNDNSLANESKKDKTKNVLLENVYRMFGITAFPVKDPSRPNASELLGIRVEIFNEFELKFETPYYIILKQNPKTMKWVILNHTIPTFVQLRSLATSYDDLSDNELLRFVRHVRSVLELTSMKHQMMDYIKTNYKKYISHIQKDVAMNSAKFLLTLDDVSTEVTIRCGLKEVESVYIEKGFTETEKTRVYNVLKGEVQGFVSRLCDVLKGLEL